ncbi:MAG: nucleoside-diphosphate sugar epimerase [Thermomonas sp.]|uniref:NAD-dependent epimerase/dehydratase family protein n=1 Tax=Thermomonas sp. TaxID=1971895 RepID=UPI0039E2CB37
MRATKKTALVFGGSAQIGECLLVRLHEAGWNAVAVSRSEHAALPGVRWLRGDLSNLEGAPTQVDAIFSCGPLGLFAQWLADADITAPRVIAFGSTSADTKQDSSDAAEREVAASLRAAEARLFEVAQRRGIAATVLRPTLVYGLGRDANLSRIAALATRLHGFALPSDATGLRQPVHADDLAIAALACVDAPATHGRTYAVPGGDTMTYRDMVLRVLAALPARPRLFVLPPLLFRALLRVARMAGLASGFGDAALARMREDLAFDAEPARRDFGYAPRAFRPDAGMFGL